MIFFQGNNLVIDGKTIALEFCIMDAVDIGGATVVLFDPDEGLGMIGQFKNVIAMNRDGTRKWTAEMPTNESMDRYYQISSINPLIVDSICSFSCELDPRTGSIVKKMFYK